MTTQLKENNFSIEGNKDPVKTPKPKPERPNIDHLIKRILDERKRERKNTIFTLIAVFSSIILIVYFFSN
jgi:hypothetical protein